MNTLLYHRTPGTCLTLKILLGLKEKDQQWRTHIAVLTSNTEKTLQDRLKRLKRFREFQRMVLVDESGMDGTSTFLTVNQLLTRM